MDGRQSDHSDSDSGESWTILDNCPSYGFEAEEPHKQERETADNTDREDDTDGISIISDSDPESLITFENLTAEPDTPEEAHRPTEQPISQYVLEHPLAPNKLDDLKESIRSEGEFLGDKNHKLRTYVHKRNKRLSTVLNIIVLGSIITAAGVAIGHMWGVRDDCVTHTPPSVNKILSNLYKLQEENEFLRSKIKELTLINMEFMQRKSTAPKQHRCKKVFEESLNSNKASAITKCVDTETRDNAKLLEAPEFENEFVSDIDKLKNVYQQNKSWLDEEIAVRYKAERSAAKHIKKKLKADRKKAKGDVRAQPNVDNPKAQPNVDSPNNALDAKEEKFGQIIDDYYNNEGEILANKVSYADSLKSQTNNAKVIQKRDISDNSYKDQARKKKNKKDMDTISEKSWSDLDIVKDNRNSGMKYKDEKKKNDRKSYKKQKRKNKYQQWEMKGGYMKDYDELSITSSENESVLKLPDKNFDSRDFELVNYTEQFTDVGKANPGEVIDKTHKETKNEKVNKKKEKQRIKDRVNDWYEKRASQRSEARKLLEKELFGEKTSNPAGWYFRRMQKREQCRVKGDNTTYKKLSKRNMNFKLKY